MKFRFGMRSEGRRTCLQGLIGIALMPGLQRLAIADDFPTGPVRVVSPAPPGGTLDTAIRIVAERVGTLLGQALIIDSRTGASGNIAGEAVARATPDGYTLLLGYDAIHATNPHVFSALGFDGLKDFEPILEIGTFPIVLVVRADFPVSTLTEFVAYATNHPNEVSFGTPGVASTHHLAAEAFEAAAHIQMTHIPYKGADGVSVDLAGRRLDAGFFSLASAQKVIKAGQGRAIAVAERTRVSALPEIPTFAESYPAVVVQAWFGLLAPRRTSRERIVRLEAAFAQALGDITVLQKLRDAGVSVTRLAAAEFSRAIQSDYDGRGRLIKALGIRNQ